MIFNHAIDTLLERRSIRAYRPEQISEEELSDILMAARFAPSSYGKQERHMTVIQNKKFLAEILTATERDKFQSGTSETTQSDPFYNAPTVIVFSAPQKNIYAHEDAAFAAMNLMTAAHAYGLGSCYIGSASGLNDPEILKRLNLPDGYTPIGCVTVGYAAENAPPVKPRRENDINYIY